MLIFIKGDDLGKIWVYDIGEQLAVPQQDDYNKFVNTLQVSAFESSIYWYYKYAYVIHKIDSSFLY